MDTLEQGDGDDPRADMAERMEKARKRSERTGTATAVCEECGKESEWPAASMGTTETCPHCDAYMDVPDPDDDWGDVDFGEEEVDMGLKENDHGRDADGNGNGVASLGRDAATRSQRSQLPREAGGT